MYKRTTYVLKDAGLIQKTAYVSFLKLGRQNTIGSKSIVAHSKW